MIKGYTLEERAEQLRPYLDRGCTTREAAEAIGLSYSQANKIVSVARSRGLLERRKGNILKCTNIGSLGKLAHEQSEDIQHWIRDQIPEGGTLSELAMSCMVDAYFEEKGDD